MNRRKALAILAMVGLPSCKKPPALQKFTAYCFGIEVGFQTYGISSNEMGNLGKVCRERLLELEQQFSLYRQDSLISQLNRHGELRDAPTEFVEIIKKAVSFGELTNGIFDISVQPLWEWRQEWKTANLGGRKILEGEAWEQALGLVDFQNIRFEGDGHVVLLPGMKLTLNGMVQGYASDVIRKVLIGAGVTNALVNIGEYASLGSAPNGEAWEVEIRDTKGIISLRGDQALAVSAGKGYTFDPEGRFHHIFRPRDGGNLMPDQTISVTAEKAMTADILATTFAVAEPDERRQILKGFPDAACEIY